MRIIVIGDGKVGRAIIEHICQEGHEVVVIDKNPDVVEEMINKFDVMGITGNGASYEILRKSSRMQINWYFGLPIAIAVINSFFGVRSLLFNLLSSRVKMDMTQEFVIALLIILLLGIFEAIYIIIVKKNSDRFLWTLMETKREE